MFHKEIRVACRNTLGVYETFYSIATLATVFATISYQKEVAIVSHRQRVGPLHPLFIVGKIDFDNFSQSRPFLSTNVFKSDGFHST
jgi:hypothetical protein